MEQKQTIVLTGFMGSGKSAVGRMLARQLNRPFRDLDQVIEEGEKRSIAAIFRSEGETHFRKLEYAYLKDILSMPALVVALGGGALQQQNVMDLVKKKGIMAYLNVPEDTLFQRLADDRKRPLLRGERGEQLNDRELRAKIHAMLIEREPLYRRADVTLDIAPRWTIRDTTNELIKILTHHAPAVFT